MGCWSNTASYSRRRFAQNQKGGRPAALHARSLAMTALDPARIGRAITVAPSEANDRCRCVNLRDKVARNKSTRDNRDGVERAIVFRRSKGSLTALVAHGQGPCVRFRDGEEGNIMAVSKDELEQFKFIYSLEDDRAKSLTGTGNIYITLIGLFLGYLGYKSTDTQFAKLLGFHWRGCPVGLVLYGLVFACLLIALAATLLSLFMHNYERPTDLQDFLHNMTTLEWADAEAFFDLAFCISAAAVANFTKNNIRAGQLAFASRFLFAALVLYAVAFLFVVTRPPPVEVVL
jgi:hypothetical protein